jgi:hypothetical protein
MLPSPPCLAAAPRFHPGESKWDGTGAYLPPLSTRRTSRAHGVPRRFPVTASRSARWRHPVNFRRFARSAISLYLRENPWIFRVLRVENRQLQPHGRMTRRTVFDPACFSSGALWNFCNNSCSLCRKRLCCKFPLQRRVSAMRILPLPRGLTPGLTRGTVTAPMAEALVGCLGSAHGANCSLPDCPASANLVAKI